MSLTITEDNILSTASVDEIEQIVKSTAKIGKSTAQIGKSTAKIGKSTGYTVPLEFLRLAML